MKQTHEVCLALPKHSERSRQYLALSVEQEGCLKTRHFSALMLSAEIETAKDSTDIEVTTHESELHFFQSWKDFLLNAF